MCETKALHLMLEDTSNEDSNQWGCTWCRGTWDCAEQPPHIRHDDDCTIINARTQLAALQSAAQGMNDDAARIKALTDAGKAVVVARHAESVRDGSGRADQSLPEAIEAFATVLEADSV